jgi:hypothetical protein
VAQLSTLGGKTRIVNMHIHPLGREDDGFLDVVEIHHMDVGMGRLLRHLRRLPGLCITKRRSWHLTDDYWIEFTWRGFQFSIDSPFVHYWIHRTRDCPDDVFQELLDHVGTLQVSFLRRWYFRLRDIRYDETVPKVAA